MDWKSLLLGDEEWNFLLNTALRTTIMFLVILIGLRLLGKRGIHQLSVFELGVIIGLGSAAGDPMFYKDVGVLPSFIVFAIVVVMYRLSTYLISTSDRFETFMEGRPHYVLREGVILESFRKQPIAKEEFFATLRQHQVSHLGQVERAIIEGDGQLSIFYYPDENVVKGLPILPDALADCTEAISAEGHYSCYNCGNTQYLTPATNILCNKCNHNKWVRSSNEIRIK